MSRSILGTLLLALAGTSAVAQTDAEYLKLRDFLDLTVATVILPSSPSKLAATAPFKIYLAIGEDQKGREHLDALIDKWNRGEGAKLGTLEVVVELEHADLIIARYKGDRVTEERAMETILPPTDATRSPTSNAPAMIRRTVVYRPLYVYLIVRTPSALEVAYRHVDRSLNGQDPDGHLVSELKKKIKRR